MAGVLALPACVGTIGDGDVGTSDDEVQLGDAPADEALFDEEQGDDPAADVEVAPGCVPVPEDCDNGIDDDCDRYVDGDDPECDDGDDEIDEVDEGGGSEELEGCTDADWQTVTCAIPNCNTHMGDDEAECYSWGNAGGCTPLQFQAWCTRRVDEGPNGLWYQIHEQWVDDSCGGSVSLESGANDVYVCEDQDTCIRYECQTPLVLVFDPEQAVAYHRDDGRSSFDLSAAGDGSAIRTDWPTAATPWLAIDRDGDGRISSGRELFGSASPAPGGTARHGFEALGQHDSNGDGILSAADSDFARIMVWADANHDRISQPAELRSLSELGIETLELGYLVDPRCDERGNCEVERARFTWRDSSGTLRQGAIVDVHLRSGSRIPWCPLR